MVSFEGRNMLVTGGSGFIGSELCRQLARKSANVVVYDNLSSGVYDFIKDLVDAGKIKFVRGDVLDSGLLDKTMKENDIDIIAHLSANADISKGTANTFLYLEQGAIGTNPAQPQERDVKDVRIVDYLRRNCLRKAHQGGLRPASSDLALRGLQAGLRGPHNVVLAPFQDALQHIPVREHSRGELHARRHLRLHSQAQERSSANSKFWVMEDRGNPTWTSLTASPRCSTCARSQKGPEPLQPGYRQSDRGPGNSKIGNRQGCKGRKDNLYRGRPRLAWRRRGQLPFQRKAEGPGFHAEVQDVKRGRGQRDRCVRGRRPEIHLCGALKKTISDFTIFIWNSRSGSSFLD